MEDDVDRMPGQLIERLLAERGWTQRVLAVVLRMDEGTVNRMVTGKRDIDAGLALALGEVFGVEAERFMDLQNSYDLARARMVARADPGRATRAQLFGRLPIAEMMARGWIETAALRDVTKVEAGLCRFFGVPSVDQIEFLPHAPKKTDVFAPPTAATRMAIPRP